MLDEIERQNPVDIGVIWSGGGDQPKPIPAAVRTRLGMAPGVTGSVLLAAMTAELRSGESTYQVTAIGYDPAIPLVTGVAEAVGGAGQVSGSIAEAATIEQVLNIVLAITTALLGVAVLIALIGVCNTLGLSVLERTRESALLRALGLQSRSLRGMLTIEALQVTLVGVPVGLVAGGFFGWLAVTSIGRSAKVGAIRFAVDVPQTLSMLGLAVVAAALASVLPGRRAAKAAPTEAPADI